jgi:hypothetical protein
MSESPRKRRRVTYTAADPCDSEADEKIDCSHCTQRENKNQCRAVCASTGNICRRGAGGYHYCKQHRSTRQHGINSSLRRHIPPIIAELVTEYDELPPPKTIAILDYMVDSYTKRESTDPYKIPLFGIQYTIEGLLIPNGTGIITFFIRSGQHVFKTILGYFIAELHEFITMSKYLIISITDNKVVYRYTTDQLPLFITPYSNKHAKPIDEYKSISKPTRLYVEYEDTKGLHMYSLVQERKIIEITVGSYRDRQIYLQQPQRHIILSEFYSDSDSE